jgi:hypothetical protein
VLGLDLIHTFGVDVVGQGPAHQHLDAVADPFAHRVDTRGLRPSLSSMSSTAAARSGTESISVPSRSNITSRGSSREQLLEAAHGRASASSARILSMTS